MIVTVCDYCAEDITRDTVTLSIDGLQGDSGGGRVVSHYHENPCFRRVAETLLLLQEVGPTLEGAPTATPQRIAALRRKHKRGED